MRAYDRGIDQVALAVAFARESLEEARKHTGRRPA
jgi:hypothetical protein